VSKVGGEPRGCCAWPRIPWYSGPHGMAHCCGAEARYQKTKILCQYYLVCARWLVEFISNLSDHQMLVPTDYCIDTVNSLVGSRCWWPACVWIIIDGHTAIFKLGIPLKCLGPTQRCFSECLL
jgi:hypothetical protein